MENRAIPPDMQTVVFFESLKNQKHTYLSNKSKHLISGNLRPCGPGWQARIIDFPEENLTVWPEFVGFLKKAQTS